MLVWQRLFIIFFGIANIIIFVVAFKQCKDNKNAYGLTYLLFPLGMFVWGDAVVFGLFWGLVALVCLLLKDWLLFWLIVAVFWAVRSLGESIYYFNQQFSSIKRQPPESLPGYKFFKNDSIWFIYQIMTQCITVVSIIVSLYLGKIWLSGK